MNFPIQPPEPKMIEPLVPNPDVAEQIVGLVGQPKNEPEQEFSGFAINLFRMNKVWRLSPELRM